MARVKGAMMTRKRRNKILKLAKGYWGSKSKHFKMAKQAVKKSLASSPSVQRAALQQGGRGHHIDPVLRSGQPAHRQGEFQVGLPVVCMGGHGGLTHPPVEDDPIFIPFSLHCGNTPIVCCSQCMRPWRLVCPLFLVRPL